VETTSASLDKARAQLSERLFGLALNHLARAVTQAWNDQDASSLEEAVAIAGEIAWGDPDLSSRAQQIRSEAIGYLSRLRPAPVPQSAPVSQPEPQLTETEKHIEEFLTAAESQFAADPQLAVILLRDEADAAETRDDLASLDRLAEAAERWASEGHSEAVPVATDLRRTTERLRWRLRRTELGTDAGQATPPPQDIRQQRMAPPPRSHPPSAGSSETLAPLQAVRSGFWKPWMLAVVALLILFSYLGMIQSEQAGGDPNSLEPLFSVLWIVLLLWAIIWAIVRSHKR
jgi:hypothetical protein